MIPTDNRKACMFTQANPDKATHGKERKKLLGHYRIWSNLGRKVGNVSFLSIKEVSFF